MAGAPTTPPSFVFVAVNAVGTKKFGVRAAPSAGALADGLRRDHLLLLKSWRLPSWAGSAESADGLPLRDEAALNEQLATLLQRGVPLIEALEVGATVVSLGTRTKIERMREMVSSGASFADACERVGGFDTVAVAVYRSAERTGDLGGAASRLAASARRRMKIGGKAVTLAIYPTVVLAISVIVITIMLLVVVPALSTMLRDMNATLPWYSEAIFDFADFARRNTLWMLTGVVGLLAVIVLARKAIIRALLGAASRLPVFRRMRLAVDSARFFSVMGAMSRSGVPVADALRVSAQAISEPRLRTQLERLERRLVEGGVFRSLIDEVDALPVATRRLLIAAERAGDLDGAFDALATDMAEEVDTLSDRMLALLEPALLVLMFMAIGSLLIAIMLPMLTMFQSI